ncbi:hypothetical protein KIPB_010204, partial [Kipferlia bialata]
EPEEILDYARESHNVDDLSLQVSALADSALEDVSLIHNETLEAIGLSPSQSPSFPLHGVPMPCGPFALYLVEKGALTKVIGLLASSLTREGVIERVVRYQLFMVAALLCSATYSTDGLAVPVSRFIEAQHPYVMLYAACDIYEDSISMGSDAECGELSFITGTFMLAVCEFLGLILSWRHLSLLPPSMHILTSVLVGSPAPSNKHLKLGMDMQILQRLASAAVLAGVNETFLPPSWSLEDYGPWAFLGLFSGEMPYPPGVPSLGL